jgi:hypothetical protein
VKSNFRWATRRHQNNDTRQNRLVEAFGRTAMIVDLRGNRPAGGDR